MPLVLLAFGLSAAACTPASADEAARPTDRLAVRVYTNDDLERIHPYAGQTGGSSLPAFPAEDDPGLAPGAAPAGKGEAYWRGEAAAVRERIRILEERAAGLRARIAERERAPKQEEVFVGRRRSPSGAASGSGSIASLQVSLAAVERRMQRAQDDLEDRARRDGALPGWLR
jgi:hypothetical protein